MMMMMNNVKWKHWKRIQKK